MLQRRMRRELLEGIPPAQRSRFADVPIEVLSDADFARLTRSAEGQAVILIEEGNPRVVLRESADPLACCARRASTLRRVSIRRPRLACASGRGQAR